MRLQRLLFAGLFTALAVIASACGNPFAKVREAAERTNYMNDMKQIGLEMHNFHDRKGRMPKDANELIAASPNLQGSTASNRLLTDEIVMMWEFKLPDQTQGVSITLMGYSMSPVFKGNAGVIYADGSVRQVDLADFATIQRPVFKVPGGTSTAPTSGGSSVTRPTKSKIR
jgi:hypothetical protein